jgi:hypothetical protein
MPSQRDRGTPPSPLVEAAQAFDRELTSYGHLAEALLRAPLGSTRHLEKVNETLGEIAQVEERLGLCGQALATALNNARDEQQRLAQAMIQRLPEIKQRSEELQALMGQFAALGDDAGALNADVTAMAGLDPSDPTRATEARKLSERMAQLGKRAREVSEAAKAAAFEELAREAHSLHQKMLAAANRLQLMAK